MRSPSRLTLACLALCASAACTDDPRATVRIVDTRTSRDEVRRVVLDVDVEAHEGLGGSVGNYCVYVQFPFEEDYGEHCNSDLGDGDTKSLRFTSERTDVLPPFVIRITIRVGQAQTALADVGVPP